MGNGSKEIIGDDLLGHSEIHVVSRELKGELGVALIDSGSQVSLMKEASLIGFSEEKGKSFQIVGITGKQMEVKGKTEINTENTLEPLSQMCYVVDSLLRNLDIILGQDWLDDAGYGFQKKTAVVIPPYSEQVVSAKHQREEFVSANTRSFNQD
jgi:hypothetical protein